MGQFRAARVGPRKRPAHRRPLGEIPMTTLTLTRQSGSYNDGYADNLSLKILTPSAG